MHLDVKLITYHQKENSKYLIDLENLKITVIKTFSAPVVMRTSAGEGHSYLLDEQRETPVDPNSILTDINRRPSREEYRKLSRLIPQRDQNLINRRISTISR